MQSSKTSKQSRAKATEATSATAETVPVKEAKSTARTTRPSQSKKTLEPVPAAAKSHRKTTAKTTSAESKPAKAMAMATAVDKTVAVATDPVGPMTEPTTLSHEQVANLAHTFWVERNYEHGYAEHDWHRATHELLQRR